MKRILLLLMIVCFSKVYAQKTDTLQVTDRLCESTEPNEIDTTVFNFISDTLVVRNIKRRSSLPKELIALKTTRSDTIVLELINPSGVSLLMECPAYGYTVKIPNITSAQIKLIIDDEFFEIINPLTGLSNSREKIDDFLIFPNPGTGDFKIELAKGVKQIRIYNLTGQIMYELETVNTEIRLTNFIPGIYKVVVLKNNAVTSKNLLVK